VLEVERHRTAKIPKFESLKVEMLHDRVIAEMLADYLDDDVPAYLAPKGR
jgi:ATP-dependent Lhr-like helicase